MKLFVLGASVVLAAGAAQAASVVTAIDGSQGWTDAVTNAGGAAEIVDLTGQGGNLENNAPNPTGAVKLTTDGATSSRAEIGVGANFGVVSDIFDSDLAFSYSWHGVGVPNDGPAAPSFKLAFFDPTYAGDGFGQLIFEPYAQGNGSNTVAILDDTWVTESIDLDNGRFWNTGMFGIGSSAGGPPYRTLSEWLTAFAVADPNGFSASSLVGISIGLGTFNVNEIGYTDGVSVAGTLADGHFDFEAPAPVPVPATLPLLMAGIGGFGFAAWRRKRTPEASA